MVSPAHSRKALEDKIRCARLVHEWKRRSVQNRCPVSELALKLGLSRKKTQNLIDLPPKKLVVPREKIRLIREAAKRVSKPVRRREVASKLALECNVTHISSRTVRRVREPYKQRETAIRKGKIRDIRAAAQHSQGMCPRTLAQQAAYQGW
jgi:hypothetical protein